MSRVFVCHLLGLFVFGLFVFGLSVYGPAFGDAAWMPTVTPMSDPRWAPAYSMLPDGRGLIAGGYSFPADRCVATGDVFDPATRRFSCCRGRLVVPRNFAQASPLPDGDILVSGGYNTVLGSLDSAEVYHPVSQTFSLLPGRMTSPRELFTATTLLDGHILCVGGFNTHRGRTQQSADLFDPATQTFNPTGQLTNDRFGQDAVRLADGRVLVVGGTHWFVHHPTVTLATAELFNPATGQFHLTRTMMNFARDRPTATLLASGQVLVAGGQNDSGEPMQAELFDPATEKFTLLANPMVSPRMAHTAAILPGGDVLVTGGWSISKRATLGDTEIFDPQRQKFIAAPSAPGGGHDQALLVFPSGLILIAGGKEVGGGKETSISTGYTRQISPPQNSHQ